MSQMAAPNQIDTALGRSTALKLRAEGLSYKQIGEKLGVSHQTAHNWVTSALEEIRTDTNESVVVVRQLESERLDRLLTQCFEAAEKGSLDALNAVLKIMERRAKLQGLDAPTKTQALTVNLTENSELLEQQARRMGIPVDGIPEEVKALPCLPKISLVESKLPEPLPSETPAEDCSTTSDTSLSTVSQSPADSPKSPETGSGKSPRPMPLASTGWQDSETLRATYRSRSGSPSLADTTRPVR